MVKACFPVGNIVQILQFLKGSVLRAVPEKKTIGGRGKNSGRGSVENTIFRQRGSASCEGCVAASLHLPLVQVY